MNVIVKGRSFLTSDALTRFMVQYEEIYAELLRVAGEARDRGDYDKATNALATASGAATAMYMHTFQAEQPDGAKGHHARTQELDDLGDDERADVDDLGG